MYILYIHTRALRWPGFVPIGSLQTSCMSSELAMHPQIIPSCHFPPFSFDTTSFSLGSQGGSCDRRARTMAWPLLFRTAPSLSPKTMPPGPGPQWLPGLLSGSKTSGSSTSTSLSLGPRAETRETLSATPHHLSLPGPPQTQEALAVSAAAQTEEQTPPFLSHRSSSQGGEGVGGVV